MIEEWLESIAEDVTEDLSDISMDRTLVHRGFDQETELYWYPTLAQKVQLEALFPPVEEDE